MAYVVNEDGKETHSNTIAAFAIGADGQLTLVGAPVSSGGVLPFGVTITPDARYLYVANLDSSTVAGFSIGQEGSLSQVGTPLPTNPKNVGRGYREGGSGAFAVVVAPDGRHLYASNRNEGTVAAFSIAADGRLTPVPGSPFDIQGKGPRGMAISPDGRRLYTMSLGPPEGSAGSVSVHSIAADGSLIPTRGSPFTAGKGTHGGAFTPDGRYFATVSIGTDNVSVFKVAKDGRSTGVAGSPFVMPKPRDIAIMSNGRYAYVLSQTDNSLAAFSINADGQFSPVSGAHYPTGGKGQTVGVVATPDGNYLYSANTGSNNVAAFAVRQDGALTAVPGSPFVDGLTLPGGIAILPNQPPMACFSAASKDEGWSFDASASRDPDNAIASYAWDFGDGQVAVGSTPKITHRYAKRGRYTVTLRVADNAGCSTQPIFTGMIMLCNGSPVAQASHRITHP